MSQKVLSYDIGGTKIAVGVVSSEGDILNEARVPIKLSQGKNAVIRQIVQLGQVYLDQYPQIKTIGIASAGPLDPIEGVLLNPTNFGRKGKLWGRVPITSILKREFKREVYLENDAAASALAEKWVGLGRSHQNLMVLTLGTGLGTGIICNGTLQRSGRNLHTEAGHMIIQLPDSKKTAPHIVNKCGCGNRGCAEAYLSGSGFERRTQEKFPDLTSKAIADLARKKNPQALEAFSEYSEIMAVAIHNYTRIFNPEIVIFAGSFAETSDLFLKKTEKALSMLLKLKKGDLPLIPQLAVSTLNNKSGLIGAAQVALSRR